MTTARVVVQFSYGGEAYTLESRLDVKGIEKDFLEGNEDDALRSLRVLISDTLARDILQRVTRDGGRQLAGALDLRRSA